LNELVTVTPEISAREAWLRERMTGIGSSDASAVAGVNPWRSPVDVWLEKTGNVPPSDDKDDLGPTYWGKRLENLVIEEYRNRTGAAIGHQQQLVRHREHPFMLATLDAIAVHPSGGPRPLEAKTTRFSKDWGDQESDEVPVHYVFQVQHQLAVTGFSVADIAVLIGGSDFRIYRIQRDEKIIEALVKVETEFWEAVMDRRPPPLRREGDGAKVFPNHISGLRIEADQEHYEIWKSLTQTNQAIKALDDEKEALTLRLQAFMGEAETLVFQGDKLATWRRTAPIRRVDSKKLKREHPAIYEQCLKPNDGERRFLTKGEEG
jgi:putative phage-type endonuclease